MKTITLIFAFATATLAYGQESRKIKFDVSGGSINSQPVTGYAYESYTYSLTSWQLALGIGLRINDMWEHRPALYAYNIGFKSRYLYPETFYFGGQYQIAFNPYGVVQLNTGPYLAARISSKNQEDLADVSPFDLGILTKFSIKPIKKFGLSVYAGYMVGLIKVYDRNPSYLATEDLSGKSNAYVFGACFRI